MHFSSLSIKGCCYFGMFDLTPPSLIFYIYAPSLTHTQFDMGLLFWIEQVIM